MCVTPEIQRKDQLLAKTCQGAWLGAGVQAEQTRLSGSVTEQVAFCLQPYRYLQLLSHAHSLRMTAHRATGKLGRLALPLRPSHSAYHYLCRGHRPGHSHDSHQ